MKHIIMVILLLTATILAGCSSGNNEVDLVVTKVGFNPVFYPLENNKVREPAGIDVNIVKTNYQQSELYTLSSNKPVIGILSSINLGLAANHGEEFKVLAPYYREIVGPGGYSMGQLVAVKDSKFTDITDLEGQQVGIQGKTDGSTIAMFTAIQKLYPNFDLDSVIWIAVDSELAPMLVRNGDLAAAMFDSDFIVDENFNEEFETLLDFGRTLENEYGTVPPAKFFVVRKEHYDKDPETYDKVVEYFRKNYQWSQDNLAEITQLESQATGDNYDVLLEKAKYEKRLDTLTQADIDVYKDFYYIAREMGAVDNVPDLNKLFGLEQE